jgi:hypothetical protein
MFRNRFKYPSLIITSITSICLVSLAGCTSSAFVAPDFEEPLPPLPEVTANQLSSEYNLDEAAADAKYKGEKLLFNEVAVEEVVFQPFLGFAGDDTNFKVCFKNGNVRFILQDLSIMQSIETGFILKIEGTCLGMTGALEDLITIDISWIESIKGDIGPREVVGIY